jgi:hypothetical protein
MSAQGEVRRFTYVQWLPVSFFGKNSYEGTQMFSFSDEDFHREHFGEEK